MSHLHKCKLCLLYDLHLHFFSFGIPKTLTHYFLVFILLLLLYSKHMKWQGFEHLMYNLGLGGLEFSPKHTLDEHRSNGYKMPDFNTDNIQDYTEASSNQQSNNTDSTTGEAKDEITTNAVATDPTMIAANEATTIYAAEKDYNIIKLMNVFNNDKQEDIFRTMHDPFHRHPRHRGKCARNYHLHSIENHSRYLSRNHSFNALKIQQ